MLLLAINGVQSSDYGPGMESLTTYLFWPHLESTVCILKLRRCSSWKLLKQIADGGGKHKLFYRHTPCISLCWYKTVEYIYVCIMFGGVVSNRLLLTIRQSTCCGWEILWGNLRPAAHQSHDITWKWLNLFCSVCWHHPLSPSFIHPWMIMHWL